MAPSICTMSHDGEPNISPLGLRQLYYEGERIPWLSITVKHLQMALVPACSAYFHSGEKYDHTLGPDLLAVRSTYLPSTVDEFVRYTDQHSDAHRFAAIPH